MTRLRAELVCEASLHKAALALGLGEFMRLGRGEELTGGRSRASILADMVESIIAAIRQAKAFVEADVVEDIKANIEYMRIRSESEANA